MIVKRILEKANYMLRVVKYNYLILFSKLPTVLSRNETINIIIKHKLSVSRFGDGEFDLIQGKFLKFQEYDSLLSKRLNEVLHSDLKQHLVCLPDIYSKNNELKSSSKLFSEETVCSSACLFDNININIKFGNAYITRFYMALKPEFRNDDYPEKLKQLWRNRNILIVEGDQSRLGVGNDLFDNTKSIKRILCPSSNSFSKYNDILTVVENHAENKLVLLALGPTATVLAYDLAKLGIQAIDIGHVDIEYEWFLMNAEKKVDIKNKHVNEVSGLIIKDEFKDDIYDSQIIERVI